MLVTSWRVLDWALLETEVDITTLGLMSLISEP